MNTKLVHADTYTHVEEREEGGEASLDTSHASRSSRYCCRMRYNTHVSWAMMTSGAIQYGEPAKVCRFAME